MTPAAFVMARVPFTIVDVQDCRMALAIVVETCKMWLVFVEGIVRLI